MAVKKKPVAPAPKAKKPEQAVTDKRLKQILSNDLVKVELGEQQPIPIEHEAISATIHEGLMEYRVHDTHLRLLGMADPSETPTVQQRAAMARRLIEVGPFLPKYIKGAQLISGKAISEAEAAESREAEADARERRKKLDRINSSQGGPKKKEDPKKPTVSTAANVPNGVPLKKICSSINLDPHEARVILRSKKIDKPGGRWEWPTAEVEKIKAILVAGKKELGIE